MSEYQKISRWISEIEQDLRERARLKSFTESRIAHKIDTISNAISSGEGNSLSKVDHIRRLSRVASMVQEDSNMEVLAQVEREIDEIYGDLSKNDTYYFHRKHAGKDLDEMEALTTYEEHEPTFRDVIPKLDFDGVQKILKNPLPVVKSSWSDFSSDEDEI